MDYDDLVPDLRNFIHRHCTPTWRIPTATVDFVDLTYVYRGHGTFIVNGTVLDAGPGDMICVPRGGTIQAGTDPDDPMCLFACNMILRDTAGFDASVPFPAYARIGVRDNLLTLYNELNTVWVRRRPGYRILVRSILLRILHLYFAILYFHNDAPDMDPHVVKAVRYLHENYSSAIDVGSLAGRIGLNRSYFGTVFRNATGLTVKEYLNRIRVDHAENLLVSGEFPVKDVAARCGFEDPFYFCKVFRRFKGLPPSEFARTGAIRDRSGRV
ncbi:MAG: helix-turn-helix domain-containing protein [Clostridia bacterium]|nr:helix-turn-helix domain-containing protein [Clostridia bacterium]